MNYFRASWRLAATTLLIYCLPALADDSISAGGAGAVHSHPVEIRFNMEKIKLPGDETTGLLGASYLFNVSPHVYVGPAVYGTITGDRGGFFTGGGEVAWQQPVFSQADIEAGLYVGGGGGHGAPVGGGLMLRPHIDVMWKFNGFKTGVSLSQVHFPSGDIKSNQVGLVLAFDNKFLFTPASAGGQRVSLSERAGVGFDRIALTATSYKPNFRNSSTGLDETASIGLGGFRVEQQYSPNWVWGIEAAGAGKGSASGYAEVLGTLGLETTVLSNDLHMGVRGALGMGGGGSVASGSGLLSKAALYSRYEFSPDFYLSVEGGYVTAPNHDFKAKYGMLALGMNFDHPLQSSNGSNKRQAFATVQGWEWSPSVEHYTSAARKDGTNKSVDLLGMKIRRNIVGNSVYLTGQAHSAYAGGAGAFSVGLAGLGFQSPSIAQGLSIGGELLAGAAGGGGVDTPGGVIVQPMVYANLKLSDAWSVQGGVGKIRSVHDGLNSTVLDLSLNYRFGLPAR
ncbi:MAG: hypothetical protein V4525_01865 [Pseudomonadota bacterium]